MPPREWFSCPVCGEEVPAGAKACPGCGADEKTGWSDETRYDGLDLPDEDEFDYDEFLKTEGLAKPKRSPRQTFWFILTVLLAAALVLLVLLGYL